MVIWPRRREIAVPDVGAPVGATVGEAVGTKYGSMRSWKGDLEAISHTITNTKGWERDEEREKRS